MHSPNHPWWACGFEAVSCYWLGVMAALCTGLKFSLMSEGAQAISPRPELHPYGYTEATEVKSQVQLVGMSSSRLCSVSQLCSVVALDNLPSFLIALLHGFQCALLVIKFVHYDCGCLLASIHQRASCFLVPAQLSHND